MSEDSTKHKHNFEDLDINGLMDDLYLRSKSVTVGGELKCDGCPVIINVYGSLDIEIKGEDYD